MIERDDMWAVRLQEGVRLDCAADRHAREAQTGPQKPWLQRLSRALTMISRAAMGPTPAPKLTSAQQRAARRVRKLERRAARRRARQLEHMSLDQK